MIDAEHIVVVEDAAQDAVQVFRAVQVTAKGLLDDNALSGGRVGLGGTPALRALAQLGGADVLDDGFVELRTDGKIEQDLAASAVGFLLLTHGLRDARPVVGVHGIGRQVVQASGEFAPAFFVEAAPLLARALHPLAKLVIRERRATDAEHAHMRREQPCDVQLEQAWNELAAREIARSTKDHQQTLSLVHVGSKHSVSSLRRRGKVLPIRQQPRLAAGIRLNPNLLVRSGGLHGGEFVLG